MDKLFWLNCSISGLNFWWAMYGSGGGWWNLLAAAFSLGVAFYIKNVNDRIKKTADFDNNTNNY